MCTCDERRFDQAKEFITELTDKLIPMSAYNMQKLRFSIVQFNELALTTTSLAEFDGPIRKFCRFLLNLQKLSSFWQIKSLDHLDDFKKRVKDLTVDAFHGMGTNMTAGLQHVQKVFIEDGMTQEDRDNFDTRTNEVSWVIYRLK